MVQFKSNYIRIEMSIRDSYPHHPHYAQFVIVLGQHWKLIPIRPGQLEAKEMVGRAKLERATFA